MGKYQIFNCKERNLWNTNLMKRKKEHIDLVKGDILIKHVLMMLMVCMYEGYTREK